MLQSSSSSRRLVRFCIAKIFREVYNLSMLNAHRIGFLIIVLFFSTLCEDVFAQTRHKPLRVVYTDWYPYTFTKNSVAQGFEIEIFQAVLLRMNAYATYSEFPWKRCLDMIKNGNADVVISALKTPERETFVVFPESNISISRTVFVTLKKNSINYTGDLEQLKGYSIGVIMGFTYGSAFDNASYLIKDEAVDARTLIMKLTRGRNDVIAENQAVIIAVAHEMGLESSLRVLTPPIHTKKLYAVFAKAGISKSFINSFSRNLEQFKNTQNYRTILLKYGLQPDTMR